MNTLCSLLILSSSITALFALGAMSRPRLRSRAAWVFLASGAVLLISINAQGEPHSDSRPEAALPSAQSGHSPGVAKVCLVDDDVHLSGSESIVLPPTTVFEDDGVNKGKREDASTWASDQEGNFATRASVVTLAPVTIKNDARCASVNVEMLTDGQQKPSSQKTDANHVFSMKTVLDYPIPPQEPPVEIGKLIDDISVKAILTADVDQARREPDSHFGSDDEGAADCLAGAKKLAAFLGGGVGRQSTVNVAIGGLGVEDVNYGCAMGSLMSPSLFVGWQGHARPPLKTLKLISKAGEYLTGATDGEMRSETTACVTAALRPDNSEMADRQFRGVKLECQAFARDGGGGSVTVYRRFGKEPNREEPSASARASVDAASAAISKHDDDQAAGAMDFAQWWQDDTIPKEVKTFAMMAARMVALSERCPTAKSHEDKIEGWAEHAGVEVADIQPGGKYAPIMEMMLSAMRKGTAKESVEEACENAARYD